MPPRRFLLPKTAKYRTRVDLSDPKCVKEWLACLECSEARLKRAVRESGPNALAFRRWLERSLMKDE